MINADDVKPMGDETTWEPVDLGPWLRGEIKPPLPTMGIVRSDGQQFIYPGLEHAFVGETESGKTWLALGCVAAEMRGGGNVVYIHYEESTPTSTIERLHLLGIDSALIKDSLRFVAPHKPAEPKWIEALLEPAPTLVVHDGVNEAMSLIGADVVKVGGASAFRRELVTPFLRAGAASIACDHVSKDRESRGRDAYGSVHKGNALDGARILLDTAEPFGRGMRGVSHIFITKDRPGQLRIHGKADAEMTGKTLIGTLVADDESEFEPFSLMFYAPKESEGGDDDGERAHDLDGHGDEVYDVLAAQPGGMVESQNLLFAAMRAAGCGLRKVTIIDGVSDLILKGRVEEVPGKRNAIGYRVIDLAAGE